jgi:drug/metabolite transporter (DMT)-like permease
VITYLNPAVALVLGVTILDEPLRIGAVLGFALILAGSYLATRRKPEAVTPAGGTAPAGAREVEAAELR